MTFHDHYSSYAADYARARPEYPAGLFEWLGSVAPGRSLAWDAGTGNGQAARGLAQVFTQVIATDPSAEQLAEAPPETGITYRVGDEGTSGLPDKSADLVTSAQAAHWFDMPRFGREADRVLRPGGIVAIWGYGLCRVNAEVDPLLGEFYGDVVGPHWPPERRHVDTAYGELFFPFTELGLPMFRMEREWTLGALAAYLGTWSAVHRYRKAVGADPVRPLIEALVPRWGDPGVARTVHWPLFGRVGRRRD